MKLSSHILHASTLTVQREDTPKLYRTWYPASFQSHLNAGLKGLYEVDLL